MLKSGDGRQLWIVTLGAIGHAIVSTGPVTSACGQSGWQFSQVIDRRPRRVCAACDAEVAAEAAERTGVRETQLGLF